MPSSKAKSELVRAARALAERAHASQRRKAGDVPYFTHLEAVAELVVEHGYDDDVIVAAAYLHDLLEDQPAHAGELRAIMPAAVVETVEVLSETKLGPGGEMRPKAERFNDYCSALAQGSAAARRALPISAADKIHNARSLIEADPREGLLLRLSTRPAQHREQLARLRAVYAGSLNASMLHAFDGAANALFSMIEKWLPTRAAQIAADAALGLFDESGQARALRAFRLALVQDNAAEQCAALLHDALALRAWTPRELELEGFAQDVVRAAGVLARQAGEDDDAYLVRNAGERLATRVLLRAAESDLAGYVPPAAASAWRERLRRELSRLNLYVQLDPESRARARAQACLAVSRADHVTLAFRIDVAVLPDALPPGYALGDSVELRAVAEHADARAQVWVVELGGDTRRAHDGGTLHLTVSRARDARSRDANDVLRVAAPTPIDVVLRGVIAWSS
ncbi:MAG TPA: HD domain-containing protein [Polyangiaceae bacterium]|nr:HD domain-containing protein [Polyangiaceae bacterium]